MYFSADGYLHQFPLEYCLPDGWSGKSFFRLTSTRLLTEHMSAPLVGPALLVGGVDYNNDSSVPSRGNDILALHFLREHNFRKCKYLPGSLSELEGIQAVRKNVGQEDGTLVGENATERAFVDTAGNYPMISISTHGVFLGDNHDMGSDIKPCLMDEALSSCALIFAGTNIHLADQDFDEHVREGVLSGREMAQLDLRKVGLFVLSACQTGQGSVTADGV